MATKSFEKGKKYGVKYRKRSVIDDFANKKYEKPLEHGTMQKPPKSFFIYRTLKNFYIISMVSKAW